MRTIFPAPVIVTVLVPFVNVVLAPAVFQSPETDHEPEVSVIVLLPVTIVSLTVTDEALAVRTPLPDTRRSEPPEIAKSAVARVPVMMRVLLTSMRVDCVMVPEIG